MLISVGTTQPVLAQGNPWAGAGAAPNIKGTWTFAIRSLHVGFQGPLTLTNGLISGTLTNTSGTCGTGTVMPNSTDVAGLVYMHVYFPTTGCGMTLFSGVLDFQTGVGVGGWYATTVSGTYLAIEY
jgi:hypothetical protein